MNKLPKVIVIMSTYNGEKYIKEQIDSILAQKGVDLQLYIFDDISKDKTVEIIKDYEQKNKNVKVCINEKNKNFTYNFLDALFSFKDNQEYDYYAFADQDDYWVEDKLIGAINSIKNAGEGVLYCSNLKVVNQNLEDMGRTMQKAKYKLQHHDILCGNIVTGCTAVMDNKFKNIVTKHYPTDIYLHDYWLAFIAEYCRDTKLIYDSNPNHILYRQHGNNLIGSKKTGFFKKVWNFIFPKDEKWKPTRVLLKTFYEMYLNDINDKDKEVLYRLINAKKFKNRLWLFFKVKSTFSLRFKAKLFINKYY